jgi:hypothetical protein
MTKLNFLAGALFGLALVGGGMSAAPAYAARTAEMVKVENEALPSGATQAQVEAAVLKSLSDRGWTIMNRSAGKVEATYARDGRRGFSATIVVTYNKSSFSVAHKESTGLNYDAASGKIHGNYNRWINNLKADVMRLVSNAVAGVPITG